MDLNDLNLFAAIVEDMSITGAAKRLAQPKSKLSRRLARLEEHLGTRLIERNTRNLRLTESGERLYNQCSAPLENLQQIEQNMLLQTQEPSGLLRIVIPPEYGVKYIGPLMFDFMLRYPQVKIHCEIRVGPINLHTEPFDLSIRISAGGQYDSGYYYRHLSQVSRILVASPHYLEKNGTPKRNHDLKKHDCITWIKQPNWPFLDGKRLSNVTVKSCFQVDNNRLALEAAAAGVGIALLPHFLCEEHIKNGRLVWVETESPPLSYEATALYPSKEYMAPKLRVFLDYLQEHLVIAA